jgi:hypothetical protein
MLSKTALGLLHCSQQSLQLQEHEASIADTIERLLVDTIFSDEPEE